MKILIICTGNSCRSQMAHGWLKSYNPQFEVCSAGTFPEKEVNPMAIEVMAELGIDISGHKPESIEKYLDQKWDFVISVCDATLETCPTFSGKVRHRLHKGFEDPARFRGTPEQVKAKYIEVRDDLILAFKSIAEAIEMEMDGSVVASHGGCSCGGSCGC